MIGCPTCGHRYGEEVRTCVVDGTPLGSTDPLVGRMIAGRYRLVQRIGEGGMSTVYLARHVVIERLSAIKILRPELATSESHRERFLREARAVARINHEHIVEISDYGETGDGLVYLVMEYVRGESLATVLRGGRLPALRAVGIVEQVAQALARAHQMGVIHRDIKPENILLMPGTSRPDFVKVLDFGVAKIQGTTTITGENQIFGTLGYMAPEHVMGGEVDGRSDLYSLGVVFYEMLTGNQPFDVAHPSELLTDRREGKIIPPSRFVPTLAKRIEQVILRAIASDPEARHRDAYHFLMDLTASATEIPGAATAPWRWGAPSSGAGTRTLVDVPAFETAPTVPAPGSAETADLASVLQAVTGGASDGLSAAAFWRSRRDAVLGLLEEIHEGRSLPAAVLGPKAEIEAGVLGLGASEEVGRGILEQIGSIEGGARDFRAGLGRAIDVVGRDLSQARGELEGLAQRRKDLKERRDLADFKDRPARVARTSQPFGPMGPGDALVWEFGAVDEGLTRAAGDADDLEFQLSELRAQLARLNERAENELELLRAQLEDESRRASERSERLQPPFESILRHLSKFPGAVTRLRALVAPPAEAA